MLIRHISRTVCAAFGLFALTSVTQAQAPIQIGVLDCNVSGGVGFVITSQRALACTLQPTANRPPEFYAGTITRVGIDIGVTGPARMQWIVFAATANPAPGALAGDYIGASGEATFGAGLGANALVGGFGRSIALQPVSVQAQTGVSLAAGVAALKLEPRGP